LLLQTVVLGPELCGLKFHLSQFLFHVRQVSLLPLNDSFLILDFL
jgi:hypothetical protein